MTLKPFFRYYGGKFRAAPKYPKPLHERIVEPFAGAAGQLQYIRHWEIISGDYRELPNYEATWFIDPPYNNSKGRYYIESDMDYQELGAWAKTRKGQVIVCENEGADWMPFKPFGTFKAGINGKGSKEVLWCNCEK